MSEHAQSKYDVLRKFGFNRNDIPLVGGAAPHTIHDHLHALEAYGFSKEDVQTIMKKLPALLCFTAARTNRLLANLEAYGFSKEDVRTMVKKLPTVLNCTVARTNRLLANLEAYGFSREDVRTIVKKQPTLLCSTLLHRGANGRRPRCVQGTRSGSDNKGVMFGDVTRTTPGAIYVS